MYVFFLKYNIWLQSYKNKRIRAIRTRKNLRSAKFLVQKFTKCKVFTSHVSIFTPAMCQFLHIRQHPPDPLDTPQKTLIFERNKTYKTPLNDLEALHAYVKARYDSRLCRSMETRLALRSPHRKHFVRFTLGAPLLKTPCE